MIAWLVVSNIFYFPFHIWDVILPIDELIFFKMVKTTNQYLLMSFLDDRCEDIRIFCETLTLTRGFLTTIFRTGFPMIFP